MNISSTNFKTVSSWSVNHMGPPSLVSARRLTFVSDVFAGLVFPWEVPAHLSLWSRRGAGLHHRGGPTALPPVLTTVSLPSHHHGLRKQPSLRQGQERGAAGSKSHCSQIFLFRYSIRSVLPPYYIYIFLCRFLTLISSIKERHCRWIG